MTDNPKSIEIEKKFFASLYGEPIGKIASNFDSTVSRLVANLGDTTVGGERALQSIMINYVLSNPANADKGKKISAALGGIKRRAVNEFAKAFPEANLDDIISEARKSGYSVEVC